VEQRIHEFVRVARKLIAFFVPFSPPVFGATVFWEPNQAVEISISHAGGELLSFPEKLRASDANVRSLPLRR
jgi:hypothetical protein